MMSEVRVGTIVSFKVCTVVRRANRSSVEEQHCSCLITANAAVLRYKKNIECVHTYAQTHQKRRQ